MRSFGDRKKVFVGAKFVVASLPEARLVLLMLMLLHQQHAMRRMAVVSLSAPTAPHMLSLCFVRQGS